MNPLARLFTRQSKKKSVKAGNVRELGRHLDTFPTLLSDHDVYENVYASVRPIVSYFTDLEPYAQDINGNNIECPSVDAIYRPNDKFDFTSFMDAVAVGVLTGSEVNILVWRSEGRKVYPGGKLTKDNIAGYTFITKWTTDVYGNRVYERATESGIETFTDKEVMTLVHSRNPHNLSKGYSPAHAARRWTNIDDLMADYQAGNFNNRAVPSGMFIIAGVTDTDYEDIRASILRHHQGASNDNKPMFSHSPINPTTGKDEGPTITWVPFSVPNKDLELGTLFDNTNKKIDSAFAVPAVMRGVDSNSTYANASVSKREFMEGVIRPFAKKIYSQWTHELNRITGGIEAVIKVDVEIPEVADEKKVQEETLAIRDNRIRQYIDLGYSLESIKRYLETNDITALEKEIVPDTPPVIDEPDTELPTQSEDNTTVIYAPKATTKKEAAKSTNPKATKDAEVEAEFTDEEKLYEAAKSFMELQIDAAVSNTKAVGDEPIDEPTDEQIDAFVLAMMAVVAGILLAHGKEGYAIGAGVAGLALSNLQGYNLSSIVTDNYATYLRGVGASYGADTAKTIRSTLLQARNDGLTLAETKERLRSIVDIDKWRIDRIARTELNHSQNIGKLDGFKSLRDEVGGNWEKTISHANVAGICPLCASQEDIWFPLDQPTWPLGESISTFNDEGEQVVYINDWQANEGWGWHPQCRGSLIVRRTE